MSHCYSRVGVGGGRYVQLLIPQVGLGTWPRISTLPVTLFPKCILVARFWHLYHYWWHILFWGNNVTITLHAILMLTTYGEFTTDVDVSKLVEPRGNASFWRIRIRQNQGEQCQPDISFTQPDPFNSAKAVNSPNECFYYHYLNYSYKPRVYPIFNACVSWYSRFSLLERLCFLSSKSTYICRKGTTIFFSFDWYLSLSQ